MSRSVHAAGGDRMQQRLPQMGARSLDQRDVGAAACPSVSPSRVTSSRPAGAAADDDNAAPMMVAGRRHEIRSPSWRAPGG